MSGPLGGQGAGSLKLAAVETVTAHAGDAGLAVHSAGRIQSAPAIAG